LEDQPDHENDLEARRLLDRDPGAFPACRVPVEAQACAATSRRPRSRDDATPALSAPSRPTPAVTNRKPMTGEELPPNVDEINNRGYLKTLNFDFDKYDVREEDKGKLQDNANWLAKYPTVKVRVEGHCDERGTAQYNLALGEKRADAVKDYLVSLGISASRLEIISYGKEKPLDPSQTEDAWAKNRRAQFLVTAR
jgi:peptidoglycan-associated lipoprotein